MAQEPSIRISGAEKERYLRQLDANLDVLADSLASQSEFKSLGAFRAFGDSNSWDWDRLPSDASIYRCLSEMVASIRSQYTWFQWQYGNNPIENKGYFDTVTLGSASGMPWVFDFIELHELQADATKRLAQSYDYVAIASRLREILTTDLKPMDDISRETELIHKDAMQRNFLEALKDAVLLGWQGASLPRAVRISYLGAESLWKITSINFSKSTSMFQVYVMDVWQDNLGVELLRLDEDGKSLISKELADSFLFADDNAAWYMIESIDERFEHLHPVHASKALVGPFESRYRTDMRYIRSLPVLASMLAEDPDQALLRFSRRYSYAPNSQTVEKTTRQVIHRDDWADEIIICPRGYSAAVSSSVLGTDVRIFEL
jgi:hypothetical protein